MNYFLDRRDGTEGVCVCVPLLSILYQPILTTSVDNKAVTTKVDNTAVTKYALHQEQILASKQTPDNSKLYSG